MNRKVPVNELQHGMFVAELDRPWLDTPFPLQGFLIESDQQVSELRRLCEFVYVNTSRSTGAAYAAPRPMALDKRPPAGKSTQDPVVILGPAAAQPEKGALSTKHSLIHDVKTILKETFSGDGKHSSERAADASEPIYYADRDRPTLTDSRVKSPIKKDLSLHSRPPKDAAPLVYGQARSQGVLRQIIGTFAKPAGKAPATMRRREPPSAAAYGDIELNVYEDLVPVEREMQHARQTHARSLEMLEDIARDVRKDKVLDVAKVNDAVEDMVESIVRNPNAMIWLTRLKRRDNYAYGHAIDVSIYLITFGRHLGFPKEQLNHLGISGLLQDVGKIKLPDGLLQKTGMLSPKEFDQLRAHVAYSLEILNESQDLPVDVFDTVATHHERYDGSGYPRGLKGEEIGMFGAMAGIVDCFQALISERPYASPVSAHQAMQDLYSWRDKYFGGALIEQFIQCVGIFPVGSLVELNTGDVAVVLSQNKVRKMKPRLLLILDPDKKRYPRPSLLDLVNDPIAFADQPFEIRRALPPGAHGIDPKEYYL